MAVKFSAAAPVSLFFDDGTRLEDDEDAEVGGGPRGRPFRACIRALPVFTLLSG